MKIDKSIRILTLICLATFSFPNSSIAAEANLKKFQKCAQIQEDSYRLACYDAEVIMLSNVVITETNDNRGFGLPKIGNLFKNDPKSGLETEANEASFILKTTSEFGYKKTRFHLANGQVWDQIDSNRIKISRPKNEQANSVTIEKAALGSFTLRVNDNGKKIRVRRVK